MRLGYHLEELEARHHHLVFDPDRDVDGVEPPGPPLGRSRRARRRAPQPSPTSARTNSELWAALARAAPAGEPGAAPRRRTRRCRPAPALAAAARRSTSHHHLRRGIDGDLARLGRLLAGTGHLPRARRRRRTRVRAPRRVRGAGGPGQPIDMICGTSIGAVMGVGPGHGLGCRHQSRAGALGASDACSTPRCRPPRSSAASGSRAACDRCSATSTSPTSGCRTSASPPTSPAPALDGARPRSARRRRCGPASPSRVCCRRCPTTATCWSTVGSSTTCRWTRCAGATRPARCSPSTSRPSQGPVAARDYGLSVSGIRSFYDRRRGQGPPHLVSTMVRADAPRLRARPRARRRATSIADLYLDVEVEGGGLLDFSTGAAIADAGGRVHPAGARAMGRGRARRARAAPLRDGLRRGAASASPPVRRWPGRRAAADAARPPVPHRSGSPRSSSAPPSC